MVVKVIGARGKAASVGRVMGTVKDFETKQNCTVQVFRADRIFGALHLEVAAEHAQRAFGQGINRSQHLGTEMLLYAAAERQIKNAIGKLGIGDGTERMAIALVGDAPFDELLANLEFQRDDTVLDGEKDWEAFGISEADIDQVGSDRIIDLILEKMAMSELDR